MAARGGSGPRFFHALRAACFPTCSGYTRQYSSKAESVTRAASGASVVQFVFEFLLLVLVRDARARARGPQSAATCGDSPQLAASCGGSGKRERGERMRWYFSQV